MNHLALLYFWTWLKLIIALWFFYLVLRYVAGVGVGAPYFPVRKRDIDDAFTLVDVTEKDTIIDLGSGDGKILLACAKRGATAVGYELNPVLVLITKWRLRKYPKAKVYWKNLFTADFTGVTKVFIFGLDPIMHDVSKMLKEKAVKDIEVISFAFDLPGFNKTGQKGIAMKYEPSARVS
ncbi:MAG: hypothetical protein U0487_00950 [Patescibacteria group bacterium]